MDTPLAHEADLRPDEKLERWFPSETCGPEQQRRRREWLDEQFSISDEDRRREYLIDPALLQFITTHGRYPNLQDEIKPWQYKGWMLYVVQTIHDRVAHYRWMEQFCYYTGEPMPFIWKRPVDAIAASSKRSKKSAEGDMVLGVPHIVPRWHYLFKTLRAGRLLDEPIPEIHFYNSFEAQPKQVMSQIEKWVLIVERDGTGWSALTSFAEWFGWAPGVHDRPPKLRDTTLEELYKTVDITPLMEWPSDYLGTMASLRYGGGPHAFFPTPHTVVEMMARMVCHDAKVREADGRDPRSFEVNDCCLGTGRMLLHASNFSLRLSGNDIDWVVLLVAKINFALYAPWAIAPLPAEYFSATPPGPPWQLADGHRQDVFFDKHLEYYRRIWSLKQLLAMAQGMAPEEVPKPEQQALVDDERAAEVPAADVPEPMPQPVIPPKALDVPGVISLSAPNEQVRAAPPDAEPIPMKGVQLGLFNLPPAAKKSRR